MSKDLKCVYVLEMSNDTVKIGISKNVNNRIKTITSSSGLAVLNLYKSKMFEKEIALTIEKACHCKFAAARVKGEFFKISFADACAELKSLVTEWELKTNGVQVFTHEKFGRIRTVIIDGEIWFVAADVCRALDLSNVTKALYALKDNEKMTLTTSKGHSGKRGGAQMLNVVNEPGLYRLIFLSRKPEAEEMKDWVFHEVLPQIRKYGFYSVENTEDEEDFIPEEFKSAVEYAEKHNLEYGFEIYPNNTISMYTVYNGKKCFEYKIDGKLTDED